jgi:malonate-semialdehyde dehydrogenase (acetylating)/methylmalonate-semialdehyde dehydrogenase
VLCVVRLPDVGSALELINANEYGNGVAVFTRDGGVAREFVRQVAGGHGGRERAAAGADGLQQLRRLEAQPVRRPPCVRPEGVRFYTKHKAVMQRWPNTASSGVEFAFPQMK